MARRTNPPAIKWRTIVGLIFFYIAMWFDWQWVWGLLFLLWVIPDLISGVTHFMDPVEKQENPILYWVIMLTWILASLYLMTTLFFPEWKYYQ